MKTSLKPIGAMLATLLLSAALAFGQATLSSTTTTAAVGANDTRIYLTSTSGMSATGPNGQVMTRLYMDGENIDVLSIPASGQVIGRRNAGSTRRAPHISGVKVYFGSPDQFGASDPPRGACTSTAQPVLPLVVPTTGNIWDCLGSPSFWQAINGPANYNLGVTAFGPATAGNVLIGSAALPFQKLYLGTAATNNMVITPASTGAARVISMADPGGAANLAYTNSTSAQTITTTTKFGDSTGPTKMMAISLSGATAAKTSTLTFAHTDDRAITFPDATDTLVGKATTDILSNKTIPTAGLAFTNATSGAITLAAASGALGTVTATLPAANITVPGTVHTDCGTTSACSATVKSTITKIVTGITQVLDGASPATVTITGMPAFSGTNTYACTAAVVGTAATHSITNITNQSATSTKFYATNGGNETVQYTCIGY